MDPAETERTSVSKHFLSPEEKERLYSLAGNKACADCGAAHPEWASVSFGTLICFRCAGRHRSYGVHISFVRSVELDAWSQAERCAMLAGGNQRFHEFLAGSQTHTAGVILDDYGAVGQLYRQRLAARCNGDWEEPEVPLAADGVLASRNAVADHAAGDRVARGPPVWAADGAGCMRCGRNFTPFFRRHHCRRCGRCICGDCAPRGNTRPILEWKMGAPVRHCRDCFQSPILKWQHE
mmetsp:Transcript_35654/g.82847  ORF Transcript_35654/g.82847 Transcript_35654/m.82847 type:complete len:237 (+) Transcript_35654:51-761(+)